MVPGRAGALPFHVCVLQPKAGGHLGSVRFQLCQPEQSTKGIYEPVYETREQQVTALPPAHGSYITLHPSLPRDWQPSHSQRSTVRPTRTTTTVSSGSASPR